MSHDDGALAALSDDELVERVKDLAAAEPRASVALIRSLDLHAASEVVGRIRGIDGVTVTETLVVRPTS